MNVKNYIITLSVTALVSAFSSILKVLFISRDCLRLCFMHIIQKELDTVAHEWNTHRIRCSKNLTVPTGIPDELFFLPQIQGDYIYLSLYKTDMSNLTYYKTEKTF